MISNPSIQAEKKTKKKSLYISIGIQTAILIALLLPLMSSVPTEIVEEAQIVMLDFTDFRPASREGAKPAAAPETDQKEQATEKAVPVTTPVPKPKPTPVNKPKPVLTSDTKEIPLPKAPETPVSEDTPEAPQDKPTPDEVKPEAPAKSSKTATKDKAKSASKNSSGNNSSRTGGTGRGSKGDGKAAVGINWGEIDGDGLFNRRVTYRADVRKITEQEGKITISLCIDRSGKVTQARYDAKKTTIKEKDVVRKAVYLTTRYRFEKDYSAPEVQCGKMTYIFEIEKE